MPPKIANIYYTATNAPELAAFYKEALGLQERFTDGERWVQFEDARGALAVASPAESAVHAGGGAVVTFEVEDLEAALVAVAGAGGSPLGEVRDMGHGRTIACQDPAGNVFQLLAR